MLKHTSDLTCDLKVDPIFKNISLCWPKHICVLNCRVKFVKNLIELENQGESFMEYFRDGIRCYWNRNKVHINLYLKKALFLSVDLFMSFLNKFVILKWMKYLIKIWYTDFVYNLLSVYQKQRLFCIFLKSQVFKMLMLNVSKTVGLKKSTDQSDCLFSDWWECQYYYFYYR